MSRLSLARLVRLCIGCLPNAAANLRALEKRSVRRQTLRWINEQAGTKSVVDESLRFTGKFPGFQHVRLGAGALIEEQSTIWIYPYAELRSVITIGESFFAGRNCYFGIFEPITIGTHVSIGAYCYIISGNHGFERRDISVREQDFTGKPVVIGDHAWIGTHTVILPGVTIGKGAIIGANSVVTRNIPDFEIWAGSPAKLIRVRPA